MRIDKSFIMKEIKKSLIDGFTKLSIDEPINRDSMTEIFKKKAFSSKNLKEFSKNYNIYNKIKKISNIIENKLPTNESDDIENEGEMLIAQLHSIIENAKSLLKMVDSEDQIEDWIQSKITIAEDYLRTTHSYIKYYDENGDDDDELDDYFHEDDVEFDVEEESEIYDDDFSDDLEFIDDPDEFMDNQ